MKLLPERLLKNMDESSPGSSRLVCQALVEEEEGWLPSPPATSKIEIAHKMLWVGPLAEVQEQVQEEGEGGSQYELRRLSIPTCVGELYSSNAAVRYDETIPARRLCFDGRFVAIHVMALHRKVQMIEAVGDQG